MNKIKQLKKKSTKIRAFARRKVVNRPTKEWLEKNITKIPLTLLTKQLNLKSSNSIRKWCREYGIKTMPRGHWMKQIKEKRLRSLTIEPVTANHRGVGETPIGDTNL